MSDRAGRRVPRGMPALCEPPAGEAGVVVLAVVVAWVTDRHPTLLPVWAPWDFSWPAFLAAGFGLLWFARGLLRTAASARMPPWRRWCFLIGFGSIYAVLLTRFEYLAQHMFFLNRVQHAVLHHIGPFRIALSWPGATIARGMPGPLRRCCEAAAVRKLLRPFQQPMLAVLLFEGLLFLWLIPPVTFPAMLDWRLYEIMNASMVIDGLLFWFLVLDPRPFPAAPIGFFMRLCLGFLIIFPQIGLGTAIGLAHRYLYPSFSLCGRVFDDIGPVLDQQIGALVLWVPAGMMSAFAAVLIMGRMFHDDDRAARISFPAGRVEGAS
ncbi:MAG TPA: cytochrome c oxidase assembly protein [Acetobacteraceae bacterium]|nr:cytochrome c oxidase assembly protein [Acetobacteraceae bacterium]